MMTEDEARKKWCPMARAPMVGETDGGVRKGAPVVNRSHQRNEILEIVACLASDCMMWREVMRTIPSPHQPPSEWVEEPTERGYCGLAGKP